MTNDEKDAGEDAWHEARRGDDTTGPCIGGSVIPAICGMEGAHGRAYKAWMQLTGRWPDDDPTDAMEFGNFCEPFSRKLLARKFFDLHFTDGGLYAHDTMPWWRATFDLLAHPAATCGSSPGGSCDAEPAETVQQKNVLFDDWGQNGIPVAHRAQTLWEAGILLGNRLPGEDGAPTSALLAPFDRNKVKVDIFEIPLDETALRDIELMIEAAEWMRDLVKRDIPPPVDGHASTSEAIRRHWNRADEGKTVIVPWRLARAWRRAGLRATAAKARQALLGNQILARAEDAQLILARDPATGELVQVAKRRVGDRAGYTVDPLTGIVTLDPSRKWKP